MVSFRQAIQEEVEDPRGLVNNPVPLAGQDYLLTIRLMIIDNQLDDAPNLFRGAEPLEEILDTFFSLLAGLEFHLPRCVPGQFTRINGISGIVFEDNFDAGKHGLQRQGRVGDGCFVRQGGGFEDQL